MTVPLISYEMFEYLRRLDIEPYAKLDEISRAKLSEGVRAISLAKGDTYITSTPRQRITVLKGVIRMEPEGRELTLANTREHTVLTHTAENRFRALEDAIILTADSSFLDTLSSWAELASYVRDSRGEELASRLLLATHSVAFRCIPFEQVQAAVKCMTPRTVRSGEIIVEQGKPGDNFYLIWSGRAEVWRTDIYDDEPQLVAVLGPGDTFGDEALVVGGTRNASVRIREEGKLLALDAEYFRQLISRPLLQEANVDDVQKMIEKGWIVVDVRYAEEYEDGHIEGAVPLPLSELRAKADQVLDKSNRHVIVCRSGKRSAVGAFLLNQRGYKAVSMTGGVSAWQGMLISSMLNTLT